MDNGGDSGFWGKLHGALKMLLIAPIRLYQLIHPFFFSGVCRFQPTCSQYAIEAIRVHGVFKGFYLAVLRSLRRNPLCKTGYDPVPTRKEKR